MRGWWRCLKARGGCLSVCGGYVACSLSCGGMMSQMVDCLISFIAFGGIERWAVACSTTTTTTRRQQQQLDTNNNNETPTTTTRGQQQRDDYYVCLFHLSMFVHYWQVSTYLLACVWCLWQQQWDNNNNNEWCRTRQQQQQQNDDD